MKSPDEILATIHSYLGNGGLFNPELMDHDKVRELIIDCRTVITALNTNSFANGVTSMARNTLPAISLLRSGTWRLGDVERWLNAVIENDAKYFENRTSLPNPQPSEGEQ